MSNNNLKFLSWVIKIILEIAIGCSVHGRTNLFILRCPSLHICAYADIYIFNYSIFQIYKYLVKRWEAKSQSWRPLGITKKDIVLPSSPLSSKVFGTITLFRAFFLHIFPRIGSFSSTSCPLMVTPAGVFFSVIQVCIIS